MTWFLGGQNLYFSWFWWLMVHIAFMDPVWSYWMWRAIFRSGFWNSCLAGLAMVTYLTCCCFINGVYHHWASLAKLRSFQLGKPRPSPSENVSKLTCQPCFWKSWILSGILGGIPMPNHHHHHLRNSPSPRELVARWNLPSTIYPFLGLHHSTASCNPSCFQHPSVFLRGNIRDSYYRIVTPWKKTCRS